LNSNVAVASPSGSPSNRSSPPIELKVVLSRRSVGEIAGAPGTTVGDGLGVAVGVDVTVGLGVGEPVGEGVQPAGRGVGEGVGEGELVAVGLGEGGSQGTPCPSSTETR
jgi:hypothetical protein